VRRTTAAALTLAGSLLVCAPAGAADGGGGTYLASGNAYDFALFNDGSTPWRAFYLVAPQGMSFVGGTTGNEGSASCTVGGPDGSSNEIECGPLPPSLMPPQARVAFVATTTTKSVCGVTFQLYVTAADGAPFTRAADVTEAPGCGAQRVELVARPTLHGTPIVGRTIRATPPIWSAAPTRVRYRWERCTSSSCATIAGASGPSLVLTKRDAGHAVRLVVTATVAGQDVRASSSRLRVGARQA
jgi:hypothetical protein